MCLVSRRIPLNRRSRHVSSPTRATSAHTRGTYQLERPIEFSRRRVEFPGKDVPFLDPGSNIVTWDGKSWNISNNALFQARFEKFLNAPPAITPPETDYQETFSRSWTSSLRPDHAPINR